MTIARALARPYVWVWREVIRGMPRAFADIFTMRSVRAAWRQDRDRLLRTAVMVAAWQAWLIWVLVTWWPR